MTIDTVVAGRYRTTGEPLPCWVNNTVWKCLLGHSEGPFGLPVPVEVLRLTRPEFLWALQTFEKNLILEMWPGRRYGRHGVFYGYLQVTFPFLA